MGHSARLGWILPLVLVSGGLTAGCGDDEGTSTGGSGGGGGTTSSTASTSSPASTSALTGGQGGEGQGGDAQGGAGGQGGAGASGSVEADYCAPLAALICERAAACDCGAILPGGTLDTAACEASYLAECLDAYAPVTEAVAAGTARVLADEAAACIALVDGLTPACEAPRGTVTFGLCPTWFTSDDALGAACTLPYCAGGAGFCDEGTCAARPGEGDPCQSLECTPGLLCLGDVCAAPLADGASCGVDVECDPPLRCLEGACAPLAAAAAACVTSAECAVGLTCEDGSCTAVAPDPCAVDEDCGNLAICAAPRRCLDRGGEGAACASDEACLEGFGCDLDGGTCTAHPGEGEACANGTQCGPDLACTTDGGTCGPIPGDGEPCGFNLFGPRVCAEGLGCLGDVCGPLPAEGDACTTDYRCEEGLGCAFGPDGSFCVVPGDPGTACENDGACALELHCGPNGTCTPDRPTGAACSAGNECSQEDVCSVNAGGGFVCTPRPGQGEACLFDCDPGLACTPVADEAACLAEVCLTL